MLYHEHIARWILCKEIWDLGGSVICHFNKEYTPTCDKCLNSRIELILDGKSDNENISFCEECSDWWSNDVEDAHEDGGIFWNGGVIFSAMVSKRSISWKISYWAVAISQTGPVLSQLRLFLSHLISNYLIYKPYFSLTNSFYLSILTNFRNSPNPPSTIGPSKSLSLCLCYCSLCPPLSGSWRSTILSFLLQSFSQCDLFGLWLWEPLLPAEKVRQSMPASTD